MAVLLPGEKCKEKEDDNGRDGCGQPSTLERRMVFKPDRMASGCQSGADVPAVDQKDILIYLDRTILHFTNTDSPHIFIVVDGADEYLCISIRIACGSGDMIYDCLK